MTATATGRDLRALFAPESVAVVGASDDPVKWGNWLARGALRAEHRRAVHLVNRRGGEVLGRPAHRSLAELPAAPELVVLAVPPAAAVDEVHSAPVLGADRAAREPVAPLDRVVRRADDGHGLRGEQRAQVAPGRGRRRGRGAHAALPSTGGGGSPWPQASTPPSTTIVPPVT